MGGCTRVRTYRWHCYGGSGYWDNRVLRSWDRDDPDLVQSACGAFYSLRLKTGRLIVFSRESLHGLVDDRMELRTQLDL